MTISRNISVMAQGASSSGILAGGYGGTGASISPTTAGNVLFTADGSVWSSTQKIVRATVQTPTSGVSVGFTSIPSWVKRITMLLNGISTTGTSDIAVRIGSGSYVTSGYVGSSAFVSQSSVAAGGAALTTAFTVSGIIAAGISAASEGGGGDVVVSLLRIVVGTLFLGAVSDTMLLGHWYLVQPGMPRKLINEITNAVIYMWPLEVVVLLLPTGMISVLNGSIDDGWDGVLGWFWLASAVVTGVLALVTRAALKERSYSAVMAATGLMYLAILTAFCTDIIGRALLA